MPKADDEGEVAVMPTFLRKFFFILFLVFVFGGEILQGKRCIMETKQKSWAKSNSVN